ncbi:MAG TPA: M4 family metallopeptidase [Solirubrobacterales bacterium]|nr:M4 family metallopeptidase [Solirubrobacterales bacterium]
MAHVGSGKRCCCSIASPDLLLHLAENGETEEQRRAAIKAIAASASMRTQRSIAGQVEGQLLGEVASVAGPAPAGEAPQAVYDLEGGGRSELPGKERRKTGEGPTGDKPVDDAFDATEATYRLYRDEYGRDSVDGKGLELVSSIHYSSNFDNAFWNGAQMVYGDGSGHLFQKGSLTSSIDIPGHELTHGVTQFTAGLEYSSQPGALNESFSDVFGSLVKQRKLGQAADQADWLIGAGTLVPSIGKALRSMKEPGTAWSGDRQPGKMADYVDLPDDGDPANDNGGVHINSGIPNHAFYLAATKIGGNAWEKAGKIWFETLTGGQLSSDADFKAAAKATEDAAAGLFGAEGAEHTAVAEAWREVGL